MLTSFAAGRRARRHPRGAGDPTATFTVGLQRRARRCRSPARGARILVPQADVVPAAIERRWRSVTHRAGRQGPWRHARPRRRVARRSPTASCSCSSARRAAASRRCLRCIAGLEELTRGAIAHGRRRHHARRAARSRHRHGVPELRALSAPDGARQPRLRSQDAQDAQGRDRAAHRRGGGDARPRRRCSIAGRRSSRAGSGSAWRWGARWCGGPRCSSSTSRCRTSTRRCAGRCASS